MGNKSQQLCNGIHNLFMNRIYLIVSVLSALVLQIPNVAIAIINGQSITDKNVAPAIGVISQTFKDCTINYIGDSLFITAAHCVLPISYDSSIAITTDGNRWQPAGTCSVKEKVTHPKYTSLSQGIWKNDIAIIRADCTEEVLKMIEPYKFELPTEWSSFTSKTPHPETRLFIAGYGSTSYIDKYNRATLHGGEVSNLLRMTDSTSFFESELNTIGPSTASSPEFRIKLKAWADLSQTAVKEDYLSCFRSGPNDPFPFAGDSGGPLYTINNKGQKLLLGLFEYYSTSLRFCYSNLKANSSWLQKTISVMKKNLPVPSLRDSFSIVGSWFYNSTTYLTNTDDFRIPMSRSNFDPSMPLGDLVKNTVVTFRKDGTFSKKVTCFYDYKKKSLVSGPHNYQKKLEIEGKGKYQYKYPKLSLEMPGSSIVSESNSKVSCSIAPLKSTVDLFILESGSMMTNIEPKNSSVNEYQDYYYIDRLDFLRPFFLVGE